MSPETKLIIFAAAVTVLGIWWGWHMLRDSDEALPPPNKDERDSIQSFRRIHKP